MSERRKLELGGGDSGARVASVSHARDIWLYRLVAGWLRAPFIAWRRRHLTSLSDRQLSDAGIDPVLAGRGRASAARLDPNLEGLR